MELTVLKCPSCGAALAAGDIDSARSLVTCHHCKSLISLWRPGGSAAALPPGPRQPVPLPKKFELSSGDTHLQIEWRWWSPMLIFLALFCLVWDVFLVFFYSTALSGSSPIFALLCPIGHVAVGVWLTYACLAGFINRTVVTVHEARLRVWHGPLPWPGKLAWPVTELRQFFVRRNVHRGKNSSSETFEVVAVPVRGPQRMLLRSLNSEDQALFVEQELERFLRIQDQPVSGEIGRA